MAYPLKFFSLAVCLCAFQASALENADYRRALEALQLIGKASEEKRGIVDCKAYGEGCTGIIHCCGSLQCFWEDGYTIKEKGLCVECVPEGLKCQRDSQCCGHFQCDKGNAGWVDGTCQRYRREGSCYRDGQCVTNCNKSWYKTHGECE